MLTRTYRIADKLGVVTLKSSLALIDITLDGISVIWRAVFAVLRLLARAVWFVVRPILTVIGGLFFFLFRLVFGTAKRAGGGALRGSGTVMARRAARAQIESSISEDPLRSQNRTLSGLIVVLLAVLVGVVLWATGQATETNTQPLNVALGEGLPVAVTPTSLLSGVQPTTAPTATNLPAGLSAQGSMAYVVREKAQTDIFVMPINGRTPIRLTNNPADDRDPAWSPDGQRLAFASRRDDNWELYIYDTATAETQRMTTDLAFQAAPSWSNDGVWLTYENYVGGNLDVFVLRVDGSQEPISLPSNSPTPDYSPSWSPDGRRIAFVSLRDGNQDVYVFNFDDSSVINVTRTPERDEDHPAWSPDSQFLAYTALDAGQRKVFVTSLSDSVTQVINIGGAPSWSPDGGSIAAMIESIDGAQIVINPFSSGGAAAILPAPTGAAQVTWTRQPLPPALINSGGLPATLSEPLYVEEEDRQAGDPPYRWNTIPGVEVEYALLSDRVNDSFTSLREAVNNRAGWDVMGSLDDAFWQIDRPRQPGADARSWLLTGRAFALTRSGINGFPASFEVIREEIGVEILWRLWVRVSEDAQPGQLGEPLRALPWDFASRTSGDVEAYDQGGRLKENVPSGYYLDFTEIAQSYGWQRAPAGRDWRANANTINYWLYDKRDGLTWLDAMRELYTEGQLGGFVPTVTPNREAPRPTAPALEIQPSVVPVTDIPVAEPTAAPPEVPSGDNSLSG